MKKLLKGNVRKVIAMTLALAMIISIAAVFAVAHDGADDGTNGGVNGVAVDYPEFITAYGEMENAEGDDVLPGDDEKNELIEDELDEEELDEYELDEEELNNEELNEGALGAGDTLEPNVTFFKSALVIQMHELYGSMDTNALLLRGVVALDENGNDVTHLIAVKDDGGFAAYVAENFANISAPGGYDGDSEDNSGGGFIGGLIAVVNTIADAVVGFFGFGNGAGIVSDGYAFETVVTYVVVHPESGEEFVSDPRDVRVMFMGIMPMSIILPAWDLWSLQNAIIDANTNPLVTGINIQAWAIDIPSGTHVEIISPVPITADFVGFTIQNNATLRLTNTDLIGSGANTGSAGVTVTGANGRFYMTNSTVTGFGYRGVRVQWGGTFTMNGTSSVSNNFYPTNADWAGAGVYVVNPGSTFIMNGGIISENFSVFGRHGAGVLVRHGTFIMNDCPVDGCPIYGSVIRGNITPSRGGGVSLHDNATFVMNNGLIEGNITPTGGGVNVEGGSTFYMHGGTITGHNVTSYGAGVHVNIGTFNLTGGYIEYNNANLRGGGLKVAGNLNITGGTIRENTTPGGGNGGGVYMRRGSFAMSAGSIRDNTAGDGGGVVIAYDAMGSATFEMTGGTISGNRALLRGGGGVVLHGAASIFDLDGGVITGNRAYTTHGHGGGILVRGNFAVLTISSGTISNNIAVGNGGGIALSRAGLRESVPNFANHGQTVDITGGSITGNTAANGGGLGFYLSNYHINVLRQYMTNTTISDSVAFSGNIATNGVRLSARLFGYKTVPGQITPINVTQVSVAGAFTNLDIHSPLPIIITANSDDKVFDGLALTNGGATVSSPLPAGVTGVTFDVIGSQTTAGSSANAVSNVQVWNGVVDVTPYFAVQTVNGTLRVDPRPITITVNSASREFNGLPLTSPAINVTNITSGDLVGGHIFAPTVQAQGSITNPGYVPNVLALNNVVIMYGATNMTANYAITIVNGILEIYRNTTSITITANNGDKIFDATPLTLTNNDFTTSPLPAGVTHVTAVVVGSQTDVGSSQSVITSYRLWNGAVDVTNFFVPATLVNGTLTVTPRSITVTAASDSREFNGLPLTNNNLLPTANLVSGHTVSATVTGTITFPGSAANVLSAVVVRNAAGQDVTANYALTLVNGNLVITNSTSVVTITADNAEKVFDGTPLTTDEFTVSGLPSGNITVQAVIGGSQTNAGSSASNVVSYSLWVGTTNVTGFFPPIVTVDGTLTVTPRPARVIANDAERIVNQADPVFTARFEGFLPGDEPTPGSYTVTRPGAGVDEGLGVFPNAIIAANNGFNNPNYIVTWYPGTFTIVNNPLFIRTLTITANSTTVTFDNQVHSAAGFVISDLDELISLGFTISAVSSNPSSINVTQAPNVISNVVIEFDGFDVTHLITDLQVIDGLLTIEPRTTVIVANSYFILLGHAIPNFTAWIHPDFPLADGDLSLNYSLYSEDHLGFTPPIHNGTWAINFILGDNPNYIVLTVPGELTIHADPLIESPVIRTPTVVPPDIDLPEPTDDDYDEPTTDDTDLEEYPTAEYEEYIPVEPIVDDSSAEDDVEIDDEYAPLGGGYDYPERGRSAWALLNLLLTIGTGIMMLMLFITYFTGKKDKNENQDSEDEKQAVKRRCVVRLLSIIPTLAAIITFILTQDMSAPMIWVDIWTILMAVIAIIQGVLAYLSFKRNYALKEVD